MSAVILLDSVIEAIEESNDQCEFYLDCRNGEILLVTEDIKYAMEDEEALDESQDWIQETIAKLKEIQGTDDCIPLPTQYDINEYAIMESFIDTIENDRLREELSGAIHGKGAFRRFKDLIYRHRIEPSWFDHRAEAFREIAVQWLEDHQLAYIGE
jgi:hypothetical protein